MEAPKSSGVLRLDLPVRYVGRVEQVDNPYIPAHERDPGRIGHCVPSLCQLFHRVLLFAKRVKHLVPGL